MRAAVPAAIRLAAFASAMAVLAPARADPWSVEKAGFNLYRISGKNIFIRTEGCEDAPARGVVDVRKDGAARRLTFRDSGASCAVRDFLAPVEVQWNQYSVLLTRDQTSNWYRVTDSDLYLKTVGCINRAMTEPALLDLNRSGTGWVVFADGRRCGIEHAFRRFNP